MKSFNHHSYSLSHARNQEAEAISHVFAQNIQTINNRKDSESLPPSTLAFYTFQLPTQGN